MSTTNAAKILIVDDEPDLRELLADALAGINAELAVAASGAEALELARRNRPDFVITDMRLGDTTGLEVLDHVREMAGDIPALLITGHPDADVIDQASRRRPVEMMTKPLDIQRLRQTVSDELTRRTSQQRDSRRSLRLRRLARNLSRRNRSMEQQLKATTDDLSNAYRTLNDQMALQQVLIGYQQELLSAKNDDDVFRAFFRLFVARTGGVFGVALACNAEAELRIAGRFGVPAPDGLKFCQAIVDPVVNLILGNPKVMTIDAWDEVDMFPQSIQRYMVGVTILAIPLIPQAGEMIGAAILYRKGEQPFTQEDIKLAEMACLPTALAIQRND